MIFASNFWKPFGDRFGSKMGGLGLHFELKKTIKKQVSFLNGIWHRFGTDFLNDFGFIFESILYENLPLGGKAVP